MASSSFSATTRLIRIAGHVVASTSSKAALAPSVVHALQKGDTAAVTGAAGYVGSWIVKYLLERGYVVRGCVRDVNDDKKVGFLKAMPEYNGRLTLHSADMTSEGAYDEIFKGCTTVFHPAEVFMSFGAGRNMKNARNDFGKAKGRKPQDGGLHDAAMDTSQYIVDSINKSGTVKRLVYTASIASIMDGDFHDKPILDESREPSPKNFQDYGPTKRLTEKFFDYAAQASHGKWDMITGNPGDIVGPVLAPHQAAETWQGKIASVIQGIPSPQEPGGRPWMLVDARDVALFEIHLAESATVKCGSRFMLTSGDKIQGEDLGVRAMEFYPEWDCATTVAPGYGAKKVSRNQPFWMRVHLDNRKARSATGLNFRSFKDTFKATIDSLVEIGGVKPKLKAK